MFCEGLTEQVFCKQVLQPHLFHQGEGQIHTIKVENSRRRGVASRGGMGKYSALRRQVSSQRKARRELSVFFTTMIDLYGLPKDFPGRTENTRDPVNPTPYVRALEEAFGTDIGDDRFIPHLQLHEYETLLFADPDAMLPSFENCQRAVDGMKVIVARFGDIELINDGENTAPSKCISKLLPAYSGRKASAGPEIAERIGMLMLRKKCPHFDTWISKLEHVLA